MTDRIKVWDPFVRIFHWALVVMMLVAWISAEEWDGLHETVGLLIAGLVFLRLGWGLIGSKYARFRQFVRPRAEVSAHLRQMLAGKEKRYLGHNPAGGWMIAALLVAITATALTGYLGTTDTFWGTSWVEEVHEVFANLLLALIAVHVLGVIHASLKHRENLVMAMLSGWKREPRNGDIA